MMVWVLGFVLGSFIGSFLGVVVMRLPLGQSIVRPASHCDDCGTLLRWYENLPILAWLLLRGRCRWCQAPIPCTVWLIEVLTAALTAWVCWAVWTAPDHHISALGASLSYSLEIAWLAPLLASIALLVPCWALLASCWTDLTHLIIPDEISLPLQLAAPFLALGVVGSLADPYAAGYLVDWFSQTTHYQGYSIAQWDVAGGLLRLLLISLGGLMLIPVSLPFARWVYSSRLRTAFPWQESDHRAFALGAWFFVGSLIPALLLFSICAALSQPDQYPDLPLLLSLSLAHSLLGSLVGWWLPYLVGLLGSWAFARNAMGYGDVKMLAWMGAFLGPVGVLYTFFLAAVYGSLIGIPMRLLGGPREIPFGPYLVLGAVTAFLWGPQISRLLAQAWALPVP